MGRSPWKTLIVTAFWLSAAVLKIWLFFVGMVVFRSISLVKTPPKVSMPRLNGVTSRRRTSFTSPASTPPWMAAPSATTSSGLTLLSPSLPVSDLTKCCTAGMRVEPPTRMTLSIFSALSFASFNASCVGTFKRSMIGWIIFSNSALVRS